MQILSHTPLGVFVLFGVLLAFGLMQMRNRNVNRFMAYVLPVGMVALSLAGVQSSFGLGLVPFALWAAELVVATFIGYALFGDTRVSFDPERKAFFFPCRESVRAGKKGLRGNPRFSSVLAETRTATAENPRIARECLGVRH